MKKQTYNLSWDESDILEAQFNYLKESGEYPEKIDEELRENAYKQCEVKF